MLIAEYSYETDIKVQRREAFRLGKEEGISQGAEQTKIETAKKLLLENIAPEIISRATGLSLDEIEKINAELTSFQQDS